ncbi:zinc finger protein 62 homolog [Phymastichus coffea]|uniref:zinc finger protein 62 homolog n=1 Tax=Phymastichus coffea TaxID=108790 RepID=UPI00273BB392|nr:zinc finger protein 62 homolog [Phymastichus coffea]XP_058793615.1 zinc finger protein 62 homolog [Phymastichus coffea]XP_058793617.1 zinc finger protein 62 homolog [Phymastichus coffea]
MERTLSFKAEPIDQEEIEEILPDLPEPSIHVKSDCFEIKPQCNPEIKINNSSIFLNKTLINLNGILYFLERIPETVVQKSQTKHFVSQVKKKKLDKSEPCPKCGKILKRRSLKLHMQTCYYGFTYDCSLKCSKCNYQTMSGHYWLLHKRQCGKTKPKPIKTKCNGEKSYTQSITHHCEICNIDFKLDNADVSVKKSCINCSSTLTYKCKKCGELCLFYESLVIHVKTICNQEKYFKCFQCDLVTYSMSQLNEHNKTLHSDISAMCKNCESFFKSSIHLKKHEKQCSSVYKSLQNDMCPYPNHNTSAVVHQFSSTIKESNNYKFHEDTSSIYNAKLFSRN